MLMQHLNEMYFLPKIGLESLFLAVKQIFDDNHFKSCLIHERSLYELKNL